MNRDQNEPRERREPKRTTFGARPMTRLALALMVALVLLAGLAARWNRGQAHGLPRDHPAAAPTALKLADQGRLAATLGA